MWVKRTDEEIEAARKQTKRSRIYTSAALGIIIGIAFLFFRGKGWSLHHATNQVPFEEVPYRIPISTIVGLLCGWIFYCFLRSNKKSMICTKCEKTKSEDSQTNCSCGGQFHDLETLKWV
jgi:uncharacterized membrane protein